MSVAAALRKMAEAGLTIEQAADIIDALGETRSRSAGAERQARYRAREAEKRQRDVTSDVTCDASQVTPPETKVSPTPPSQTQPPKEKEPPKGVSQKKVPDEVQLVLDELVLDELWLLAPFASRRRSSKGEVRGALRAAVSRKKDLADIMTGLKALFLSDEALRDDGKFVGALHRLIQHDRWEAFLEPSADTALAARKAKVAAWDDDHKRAAMAGFVEEGRWGDHWGPRPGEPNCFIPHEIQAQFRGRVRSAA